MAARRWLRVVAEGGVGWWERQRDWGDRREKLTKKKK